MEKDHSPIISIVIPVYNVETYLRLCLDSVLAQTFTDWECILVDDGSQDNSGKICDEYAAKDARIKVVHKENEGSSAARTAGLDAAKGQYCVFVDADDWVDADYLEKMEKAAKDGADVVLCDYYMNNDTTEQYIKNGPTSCDPKTVINEILSRKLHAGLWNKMFTRELCTGSDVCFPKYNYYEDMYFLISVLQHAKKITYLPPPSATYHYRYNPSSYTHDSNRARRFRLYEESVLNLNELNKKYHLDKDADTAKALDDCINFSKRHLVLVYYNYYSDIKPLLAHFPRSMKWRYCKTLGDFLYLLASRYGFMLPYKVRGLIQKR